MADDEPLETPEMKRRLFTLGQRSSKSAEEAWTRQWEQVRAMTPTARILLALRLGERDRALREAVERRSR